MGTLSALSIRQDLLTTLAGAREETGKLFDIIRPDALYDRPIPERHRIVFYIGHLEAFDWNLFREHLGLKSFHPEFDQLFAFGIDPVDGGLPTDTPADWPSMDRIEEYRAAIREKLNEALGKADEDAELIQLLNIAIEHRLMHAETLEYMFHQLPYHRKVGPATARTSGNALPVMMRQVPAGRATLGLRSDSGLFGWDNEFEQHFVDVAGFSIDRYKVSNEDYLQFVEAGGYESSEFWSDSAWQWLAEEHISHPVFWVPSGHGWKYRTMFDEVPLPKRWPVFVSHAEARAYATWAGKRLPTEAEWHRAASGASTPAASRQHWNPPAVGMTPELQSQFGIEDLFATGWEWTSTVFAPFAGFKMTAAYPGYSANFFDGIHYVMKGGSTRTAACMLRPSFRNWFQAHYQYVYAGFRCVAR